ncbi:hypothetical protein [Paenibacillus taichungensis]|nr:hypothetical protein [Paenibacillus taichungensis]
MTKVIATDTDIAGKEWLITMIGYLELAGQSGSGSRLCYSQPQFA